MSDQPAALAALDWCLCVFLWLLWECVICFCCFYCFTSSGNVPSGLGAFAANRIQLWGLLHTGANGVEEWVLDKRPP